VVDRTGGKDGLGLTQQLLDPQQVAVAQHDLQWRDLAIGAQHVEPVEARVFGDPHLVDREVLARDGLQITAKAAIADERLVAPGEFGAQSLEVRVPVDRDHGFQRKAIIQSRGRRSRIPVEGDPHSSDRDQHGMTG
jgi:hypothetical protein